ncbi:EAL domain-containing protein [uncultured Roseobacter sp.]|uniref:putative bifunctional diguanylate cyclase/phosphodiesterase n=1 Tax=uncultured Roseobacter sp. TaxID=114847 RepID=UPI00261F51BE|nr:EAL domain-containing protein [uncultured Roseobacter sp.]
MFNSIRTTRWRNKIFNAHVAFFVSAVLTWPIMAEMELFEEFYEFSRAHEDWDLDELALLVVNLTVALILSSIYRARVLRKVMRERAQEYQRAERNARHDPLTGLMNRRAFAASMQEIEADPNSAGRYMAMIDLDRFKPINDVQGHAAGDALLQGVAERLEAMLTPSDTIARLGGDEFAVIFDPKRNSATVERIARRLLHAMEKPFEFQGTALYISCSVGLAHWVGGTCHSDALSQADRALYTAKKDGRARFAWYDAELDTQSTERAQIEAELREAITTGQIEPWFQPIVDIEKQYITGFEVLARWHHPERGTISPAVFIEIAEDSGQISALGNSLLRRACTAANDWDARLSMSFNVSPLQFHDRSLVDDIKTILQETAFDPTRLTIEVTERSVIRDFSSAREKLDALKAIGISVALDDFGTGYSSLASLRQLPFDRIKIDRGFVTDIGGQPQNQKIVTGIMSLARGLELDVTAEGIESQQDLAFIKSLNCGLGQGFLFDKAVSASDVSWLLETKWSDLKVDDPDSTATQPPDSKAG